MTKYERDAREQAKTNHLKGPSHPVFIPKTSVSIQAYRDEELFSLHDLEEFLRSQTSPRLYAIQKKYDGVNLQVHRTAEGKFKCFTDNLRDVTRYLHVVTQSLDDQLPHVDYILIGELEVWSGKKHWNRAEIAGTLTGNPNKDIPYVFTVFDIIWLDGKDIHNKVYKERFSALRNFPFTQSVLSSPQEGVNLCPTVVESDPEKIVRVVSHLFRVEGSEGAILKEWEGFRFSLNGYTHDMIKIKKFVEGHFVVLDKRLIEGSTDTYQYWIGVLLTSREKELVPENRVVRLMGRDYLKVGKTFNTNIKAEIGDIITVRFTNLTVYHDRDGKLYVGVYSPVVYERREQYEEPDNLFTLIEIGKKAGLLVEKGLVPISKSFLNYPDENQTLHYVMQHHFRGKTVHTDLRMEISPGGTLIGYTLMTQKPHTISKPVTSLSLAEKYAKMGLRVFKFDPRTGEWEKERNRAGALRYVSIECELKAPMPHSWLDFQGVTDVGSTGATANYPGVFLIVAQGVVEYGWREPHYHEYFFHNSNWKGGGQRIIFRVLRSGTLARDLFGSSYKQLDESTFITPFFVFTLPHNWFIKEGEIVSEDEEFVWLMVRCLDVRPYILSTRAAQRQKYPPPGVSALPHGIRKQIPRSLRYWEFSAREYKDVLDSLRESLRSRELKLDYGQMFIESKSTSKSSRADTYEYIYKRRWWRGPIVVRVGPSQEFWDLYYKDENKFFRITLLSDLRTSFEVAGTSPEEVSKDEFTYEGELEPESPLNPNKEIPAFTDIVARGEFALEGSIHDRAVITFLSGDGLDNLKFQVQLEDETTKLLLFSREV